MNGHFGPEGGSLQMFNGSWTDWTVAQHHEWRGRRLGTHGGRRRASTTACCRNPYSYLGWAASYRIWFGT